MTTAETITVIIATYGAILSTIAIAWQITGDRVKVKLTVQRNILRGRPATRHVTSLLRPEAPLEEWSCW